MPPVIIQVITCENDFKGTQRDKAFTHAGCLTISWPTSVEGSMSPFGAITYPTNTLVPLSVTM